MTESIQYAWRVIADESEIIEYESELLTLADAQRLASNTLDLLLREGRDGVTVQVIDTEDSLVIDEYYGADGVISAQFPI